MSTLAIFATISLALLSFIMLYSQIGKLSGNDQNNSASKRSNIHPSILRLEEQERQQQEQQNQDQKEGLKPEYDINGNLLPLYHNENKYSFLTNSIRKERITPISNEMIQQVRDCVGNEVTLEQIVFDLELTGNPTTTIDNYFESGLENPPADYYIVPPAEEELASHDEGETGAEDVPETSSEEQLPDHHSTAETSESVSASVFMALNNMYLNPQNLISKYHIELNKDYEPLKDSSSLKNKAKYMIWKARKNVEALDEKQSLRR